MPEHRIEIERPWPMPDRRECTFYHSLDFPGGESVTGHWDIRGRFDDYIGRYPLAGKSVLDVGTASGFLAFSAEERGARVTAIDVRGAGDLDRVPFRDSLHYRDREAWIADWEARWLRPLKNGFWYAWHKLGSRVEVAYTPLRGLDRWDRRFDVVIAGAVVEHVGDPVSAIGWMARLAHEAIIIAFTEVHESDDLMQRPGTEWTDPRWDHGWWVLSRGLYRRILANLGFELEIERAVAVNNPAFTNSLETSVEVCRPTIIARRVRR